jgi:hypothetical protein
MFDTIQIQGTGASLRQAISITTIKEPSSIVQVERYTQYQ